jgi:signal transduction histidine kinase
MRLIRRGEQRIAAAERDLADARARDAVGRRLHDGVLQTLALVQRRSDDPQLVDLAQEQDRDLRRFLFGRTVVAESRAATLAENLREMADRHERTFTARVEVLVPDDLPALPERTESALLGAVGEALNNAGKHAAASRVVVYLEPGDGEVFCSVRDDGVGFDADETTEGIGLTRSVRGRIDEVGGDVEVDSSVGRGTEVRLSVPVSAPPV